MDVFYANSAHGGSRRGIYNTVSHDGQRYLKRCMPYNQLILDGMCDEKYCIQPAGVRWDMWRRVLYTTSWYQIEYVMRSIVYNQLVPDNIYEEYCIQPAGTRWDMPRIILHTTNWCQMRCVKRCIVYNQLVPDRICGEEYCI